MVKFISLDEVPELLGNGKTVAVGGFGTYGVPDALLHIIARSFREKGYPKGLDLVINVSQGVGSYEEIGMNRIALPGLIDTVISSHFGLAKKLEKLVSSDQVTGYAIPLGVLFQLYRAIAANKIGVFTTVGLGTCADPRNDGCKANRRAGEQGREIVKLLRIEGKEQLFYPSFPIDRCLLRGTYADEEGNISMEHEGIIGAELEMAAAVRRCGGTVIVQVEDIVPRGSILPKKVRLHRSLVDYVVKAPCPELHRQSYAWDGWDPALTGEGPHMPRAIEPMPLDVRKVIARRAAMELKPGDVVNLGIGIPSGVGLVANEKGIIDELSLSLESGPIGGIPIEGTGFGGALDPEGIYTACETFDLYDGGFLNVSFLGAAQIDEQGNVNVSRFGTACPGPGGFINISQNTPKVCFLSTFKAGKGKIAIEEGELKILEHGEQKKFVKKVEQMTFSGERAKRSGQEVLYITERAVFKLNSNGLLLTEIAPGVDLNRDVLDQMGFVPRIADDLKVMKKELFI